MAQKSGVVIGRFQEVVPLGESIPVNGLTGPTLSMVTIVEPTWPGVGDIQWADRRCDAARQESPRSNGPSPE